MALPLLWLRFDTYPRGMRKHGIDSRSRACFPKKVYIIDFYTDEGDIYFGHIQKNTFSNMCFWASSEYPQTFQSFSHV